MPESQICLCDLAGRGALCPRHMPSQLPRRPSAKAVACQFYYPQKQVRVQISEEDSLINSGRCQDLIAASYLGGRGERGGYGELVEKALRDLTAAADSVAARTRQLAHRLMRRMVILERKDLPGRAA